MFGKEKRKEIKKVSILNGTNNNLINRPRCYNNYNRQAVDQ